MFFFFCTLFSFNSLFRGAKKREMYCYLATCNKILKEHQINDFFNREGNLYTYYRKIFETIRKTFDTSPKQSFDKEGKKIVSFFTNLTINYIFSNYGKKIEAAAIDEANTYGQKNNHNGFDYAKFFDIFRTIDLEHKTYVFFYKNLECTAANVNKIEIKELGNRSSLFSLCEKRGGGGAFQFHEVK